MNCNWWHTRPLWNHSRNPRASAVACLPLQMPSLKRWKGGARTCAAVFPQGKIRSSRPYSLITVERVTSWKLPLIVNYLNWLFWQITYLNCFFFGTVVHGLKDSLHSIGDLNNSAREIHQWCTPAAGGGGGEGNWVLNHLESRMKNLEPHLSRFKMHTQPADVHCSQ